MVHSHLLVKWKVIQAESYSIVEQIVVAIVDYLLILPFVIVLENVQWT